jgi:hypothetical protein
MIIFSIPRVTQHMLLHHFKYFDDLIQRKTICHSHDIRAWNYQTRYMAPSPHTW